MPRWPMPDWPRLQKIGSGSPSTCNRGNVFAEIGPFPCRIGNKNAPRCCFLAIAANEKRVLVCQFLIHLEQAGYDVGLGGVFREAVGLQDSGIVSAVGFH